MHVSTDEVYGSLEPPLEADENFPLNPSSPYSASKAGSDLLARSYFVTYKLPVRDHPRVEQLRAVSVSREADSADDLERARGQAAAGLRRRQQVRDWLYVDDHCRGILAVLEKGRDGEIYNIGGNRSLPNLKSCGRSWRRPGKPESLIKT